MATINAGIMLIALPTIFTDIYITPLTPRNTSFLLWILMGYIVVTSTLRRVVGHGALAAIASLLRGRQYFFQEHPAPTAVLEGETTPLTPPPSPGKRRASVGTPESNDAV